MKRIGIIPVGGKGSRWGGFFKELLPVGYGEWLIDRTIMTMLPNVDEILLVTKQNRISTLVAHLGNKYNKISYLTEDEGYDIMSGIRPALQHEADLYYFAMPDTYYPTDIFDADFYSAEFNLICHKTKNTERFGVLHQGQIVNKSKELNDGNDHLAWGALVWSKKIRDLWIAKDITDYTEAINLAMRTYDWKTFDMEYYYDMASWEDYVEFIGKVKK